MHMLATAINRKYFCHTVAMVLIIAASGASVFPAQAGVGEGISGTATIDTQPPWITVDQFPEFTVFQGGDAVLFHWQSGDSHPGTVPEHFTAAVLIDGEVASNIIYHPDTDDFSWEWIAPEVSSADVHLEVQARDAFGNFTSETTNSFTVLLSVTSVPRVSGGLNLAAPAPNPFNPSTRLSFNLPEPGRVALTVFDPRGRRVRTLLRGQRLAGDFEARWDGMDDQGRAMPGGVYIFVLDFHGAHHSDRISRKAVLIP
jgi:hypothetical protein